MTGACTLCGSAHATVQLSTVSRGVRVDVLRCVCGHCYLGDWASHYSQALYDYYADDAWLAAYADSPITAARYRALLRCWGGLVDGHGVLDIGCGAGEFVAAANAAGWQARGIEWSPAAVRFCAGRGLPVTQTDLFSQALQPASFSVCTLFEVIEHVPDPRRFLARAAELTRPGGLIYLTTPNIASLDAWALGRDWNAIGVEHLSYFTPASLRTLIQDCGLTVLDLTTRNLSGAALRRLLGQRRAMPDARAEADLRQTVEASAPLRAAKALANGVMRLTGWGSAMTALCRKP